MALKTNYHTHTTYCDGKNTPREMVEAAIERNFDILGFSGHSFYPHASTWHIAPRNHQNYFDEIRALKEEYKDRIKLYCGVEADFISGISQNLSEQFSEFNPDFIIGSVHYLVNENGFMTVDDSIDVVKKGLEEVFKGDGKRLCQEYFSQERNMLSKGGFQIMGHADLVRIRNAALKMFDEKDSWYREELQLTADAISKAGVIVEINTGGIARGSINDFYPSHEFLSLLKERNVPVTIDSDAHTTGNLDAFFEDAKKAASRAGYTELAYLEDGLMKFQKLEM